MFVIFKSLDCIRQCLDQKKKKNPLLQWLVGSYKSSVIALAKL